VESILSNADLMEEEEEEEEGEVGGEGGSGRDRKPSTDKQTSRKRGMSKRRLLVSGMERCGYCGEVVVLLLLLFVCVLC